MSDPIKTFIATLLLLLLLLLTVAESPEVTPPTPAITIVYADRFTDAEKFAIARSIQLHAMAWELHAGAVIQPTRVMVVRNQFRTSGIPHLLDGLYESRHKTITVFAGRAGEVPALYHELCHRHLDYTSERDTDHSDPRWSIWDPRGDRVAEMCSRGSTKLRSE